MQQRDCFSSQSTILKDFVVTCTKEHRDFTTLFTNEVKLIKSHVTNEHNDTRRENAEQHRLTLNQMTDHVSSEHSETRKEVIAHTTEEQDQTRDLVREEHGKTTDVIREHLDTAHSRTKTEADNRTNRQEATRMEREARVQLIKSFDFPGRGSRMSNINMAHRETFQWLFGDNFQTTGPSAKLGIADKAIERDWTYEKLVEECKKKTWHRFTEWLGSKDKIYWIKAKAGAGKSTLMKFLVEDPRTRQLLIVNGGRPMIVGHSFFLMGTPMQCNIKGFLSNLIYQILEADEQDVWMEEVTTQESKSFFRGKRSCDDWSVENLETLLRKLLALATASCKVCLFIDGLDEVQASDGKHTLLRLLLHLGDGFPLKMCLSSRPEAEFTNNRVLSAVPTLELQTLTAADMYIYALSLLSSVSESSVNKNAQHLQDFNSSQQRFATTIVEKADGVFLWAHVAVKSLERALTNGDTEQQIYQRLHKMPSELRQLFDSMWSRHGSDKGLYEKEAALYFKIVLEWKHLDVNVLYDCWNSDHLPHPPKHDDFCNNKDIQPELSLFQLTLAKRGVSTGDLKTLDMELLGEESLWKDCFELVTRLPVICAGLLELAMPLWPRGQPEGTSYVDVDIPVHFIHRTAREFFEESDEGRSILAYDDSDFDMRVDAMVRAHIFRVWASEEEPRLPTATIILPPASVPTYDILIRLRKMVNRVGKEALRQMVLACQVFHEHGIGVLPDVYLQPDFLGVAVSSGMKDYVECIFENPLAYTSEYKNYLLVFGISKMPWEDCDENQDWLLNLDMINFLIAHGCGPEPTIVNNDEDCLPYKASGLEEFLFSLWYLWEGEQPNVQVLDGIIEVLHHFARAGADFFQPVYAFYDGLALSMDGGSFLGLHRVSEMGQLFVGWPILGAVLCTIRAVWQNQVPTAEASFYRRLEEFVKYVVPAELSLGPRIIAVHSEPKPYENWIKTAKLVPAVKQELFLDIITQASTPPNDKHTWDLRAQEKRTKIKHLADSILGDDKIPEDASDYLLNDLGFSQSWPRAARKDLWDMQITSSADGKNLCDGVVFPPVKYANEGG